MNTIPTLDLRRFKTDPEGFVQEMGAAYQAWGFAGITGHGIDSSVAINALRAAEKVFALPDETKKAYFKNNGGTRGYTPFGTEIAKNAEHVDLKEFWHVGREIEGEPPHKDLTPNVWPEEVPEFKESMLRLYDELDALSQELLQAFALFIGEDRHYFDEKVNYGNSILRPLHYPPITDPNLPNVRAGAHEDINLITLLVGSGEPGLEILTLNNEWIGVDTIPGTIVCNVGDMLQRITNHVLPSTTHRVVNPPPPFCNESRYSTPYFLHPNSDCLLETLPVCVSPEQPNRYPEPITAHAYLIERLIEIGLKQ